MIVREGPDGGLYLIGQTDHSKLVGKIAARWGNEVFDRPEPYETMARAATYHDFGWLSYETSPQIDPKTGTPYGFLGLPLGPDQMRAYQWGLDWMEEIDGYAGLIVNMHRTGLWQGRYGTIQHPQSYNIPDLGPEIQEFIDRNEAHQNLLRRSLDPDQLWTNYRLMQVWDLLGLYFCCHDPREDTIDPVPLRYEDREEVCLRLTPVGDRQVSIDPFPFDERPCHVEIARRRLSQAAYPDLASFRRAYYRADIEFLRFELL